MLDLETDKTFAINFTQVSLAFPSTGGAVILSFIAPSSIREKAFFEDLGITRMVNFIPDLVLEILTDKFSLPVEINLKFKVQFISNT